MKRSSLPSPTGADALLTTTITVRHPRLSALVRKIAGPAVIMVLAWGINLLLADALQMGKSLTPLWLAPLFWLTVLTLLFHSRRALFGGLGLLVAGFGLLHRLTGLGPLSYLYAGIATLWNRLMTLIDAMGYVTLGHIGQGLPLTEGSLFFAISLISVTVVFFSLRQKTRPFPVTLYVLLVTAPLLIYNMPRFSYGLATLAAGLTALLAMRLCERHTETGDASPFVGLTALLLSALLLPLPMTKIGEPWLPIPGIAEGIDEIRQIITALAEGRLPSLSSGGGSHDGPRDTVATQRRFQDKVILTVYANSTQPLYLREWVGGDYRDNKWYTPDIYEIDYLYRPLTFEAHPNAVTERLGEAYEIYTGESAQEALGIVRETVVIRPSAVGTLIPLPVGTVSDLLAPDGSPFATPYTYFSDFLASSSRLSRKTPYAVEILQPLPRGQQAREAFTETFYHYFRYARDGVMPEANSPAHQMVTLLGPKGLQRAVATAHARDVHARTLYGSLTDTSVLDRAVAELFADTDIARYYRLSAYGEEVSSRQNGVIRLPDGQGSYQVYYLPTDHEVLYAEEVAALVVAFLRERCSYTLSPAKPLYNDAMEDFLYGSREGYCVQFATATALLLRRLGFTARYAEGYLANGLYRNDSQDYGMTHVMRVTDRHAHAWAELWITGYGWQVVEATPGYQSLLPSDEESSSADTSETSPDTSETDTGTDGEASASASDSQSSVPPVTTRPADSGGTETDGPSDDTEGRDMGPWWVLMGVLLLLFLLGYLLDRRARRRKQEREAGIRLALSGRPAYRVEELAAYLAEELTHALRLYGLTPQPGELPGAFALRVERLLGSRFSQPSPSAAVAAMAHRVYGGQVEDSELRAMAALLLALTEGARARLGLLRFLYYRYLLCAI